MNNPLNIQFSQSEMLGFGVLAPPNRDELIAYYKGAVSGDNSKLLAKSGNHSTLQVVPTSVAGDGSGIGTITGLLTSATFTVGDGSDEPTCTVAGQLDIADGDNVWDLKIYHAGVLFADLPMICTGSETEWSSTAGLPDCVWSGFNNMAAIYAEHYDGVSGSNRANVDGFTVGPQGDEVWVDPIVDYINPTNYSTYDDETGINTIVSDNTYASHIEIPSAGLGDVTISVEYLPGSVGAIKVIELEDGLVISVLYVINSVHYKCVGDVGIDRLAFYRDGTCNVNFKVSVKQGVPGVQPAAKTAPPQYPGPIAADWPTRRVALEGDGALSVTIAGLLTTDAITVADGSDTPTCTTNGTLAIAGEDVVYGITVTRGGVIWAVYPCEDGTPYHGGVTKLEDISGNGNHGTIVDATSEADIWTYVDGASRRLSGYNIDATGPEVATNGGFDTDENWNTPDAVSIANGVATWDGSASTTADMTQSGILTVGTTYEVTYTIVSISTGSVQARPGGAVGTARTTAGTYTETLTPTGHSILSLRGANNCDAVIDNVSVKEVFLGYSLQDPNNPGYDIHGNALEYKQGAWQTALQSKLEFTPPLGKPSCLLHGQTAVRFDDQPDADTEEQFFVGDRASGAYEESQTDNRDAIDKYYGIPRT